MTLATRLRLRALRTVLDLMGETAGRAVFAPRYAGEGVIFMLHRVLPDDQTILYPGYEIHISSLESALSWVYRSGWEVVTMDELCRRMRKPQSGHRFACFTFDDGYLDNYTLALPVFEKYDTPLCTYVSTGMMDRSMEYWWGSLRELILRNDRIEVPLPDSNVREFELQTLAQKRIAYDTLDALCHSNGQFLSHLRTVFAAHRIDERQLLDDEGLSIRQAREFARHRLVTIGSHAMTHRPLKSLSDSEAKREIHDSRRILQKALGVPVRHIAYPFGRPNACGEREFELARQSGYRSGVTTELGNITSEDRNRLWALPRYVLPANHTTLRNSLFGTQLLLRAGC